MEGTLRYRILVPVMVIILQILIVHNTSEPDILDVKNSEMQSDTPSNSTNFTSSGDSGLVISGEPAYVGDTLTASLMVTNNGKSSGSVSLQIRHSDGEQIFQGEYISISPGSTREVSTSFIMELPGTNEFNWQLSVLGQTGQSNLKGNLSIQVSNSQILNITADSIFWSASEGLEIDVSVFLSEGKARPILLAVSSEIAGGNENLQEILLEANPGRRVIEFSLGNPKSTDKMAMTGMALLCYLGHCELQDSPDFGPTVRKAIDFITSTTPEPEIKGGPGSYSHPIRTYALCEAYTMTKIKKLEEYARRSTLHIINGQNENGGWAYGYGKGVAAHTDLSVTGWNIQALKAAVYTGISIPGIDEALDKAIKYTKECQDKQGKFAYQRGKGGKSSLTGAGVLCLQIWKNAKSEEAEKGLEWIVQNEAIKTEWSQIDVYGWYYNAQACFQATGVSGGSKFWKAWNKDFQQTVCSNQAPDGHWPHGNHFHGDTDIYRTTMTILMLEVYYRYMPSTKV